MKIADDHMYYGAAITQIAEHKSFKAINKFESHSVSSQCAYWVNPKLSKNIGLYLKYRSAPNLETVVDSKDANVYIFVFNDDTRAVIDEMAKEANDRVYIGCVCVEDRQICCISLNEYREFYKRRSDALGRDDDQFRIQVAHVAGGKFRTYVTTPGKKKQPLGGVVRIAQNAFPNRIFG